MLSRASSFTGTGQYLAMSLTKPEGSPLSFRSWKSASWFYDTRVSIYTTAIDQEQSATYPALIQERRSRHPNLTNNLVLDAFVILIQSEPNTTEIELLYESLADLIP